VTEVTGGGTAPGGAGQSGALDAAEVSQILARLLELTGVTALPEQVRDAAFDACHHASHAGGSWRAPLLQACRRVGLTAAGVEATPEAILPTVGPGQPVLVRAQFDGHDRLAILSGLDAASVVLELPGESEPRRMSPAAVGALVAASSHGGWITLEAPLPRAELAAAEDGHGHGAEPRARLWAWMALEKQDIFTVLVYAVFVGFFTLTTPIAVQALVNTVAFGTLLQPLVVLSLLLFGALAFAATLRGLQFWVVEVLQRRIFVRVVADLARRLPRVRRDALDGHDGQELANRYFEVVTLQKAASSLLLDGLEVVLTISVGMLVLAFYHPFLFAFDIGLVVAMVVVAWLGRKGPATAIEESKRKYEIAAWLEELARHDVAFKLGGGLEYAEVHADTLTRSWLGARRAHFGVVVRQFAVVLTMQALAGAAVLGIGGWLVIQRQLTLGQLVAAELIVTVVVSSVAKMGKYLEVYYDLLASLDKLGHLVDLPIEREGGAPCVPRTDERQGGVALVAENLVAGYGAGPDVFSGASFQLEAGSKNAIIGADGSGKSLLVELVAALREPRSGRIAIDGWDTRSLDIESLRQRIAVVRTAAILPATVLENVRMGRPGIDAQEVRDALSAVGLLDAIERLPHGVQTELSATGEPLSPGERARVVVARAIVAKPALLVVDDALDSLQPSLRGQIFDLLADRRRPWTVLLVSDDPMLHARCDHTLFLEGGQVRTDLPRPSLVPPAPEYRR
jgi:ABC-type bacteriocin/lantibiotic exporter with double-glycine peptidase domain